MEDKKISEAAELLYKGAKMLQFHCEDCGLPLFQHEGKVICASCKVEYEISEEGARKKGGKVVEEVKEVVRVPKTVSGDLDEVEANLTEVMKKLSERLIRSESLREMEDVISVLKEIIEVSERIRGLKKNV